MGITVPAPCLVFGERGDSCAFALPGTSGWFCLCRQKEQSKVLVTLEGTGALVLASVSFWPCRNHGKGGHRWCNAPRVGDVREQNPYRLCSACARGAWLHGKQCQRWEKATRKTTWRCLKTLPRKTENTNAQLCHTKVTQENGQLAPSCQNTHPAAWGG